MEVFGKSLYMLRMFTTIDSVYQRNRDRAVDTNASGKGSPSTENRPKQQPKIKILIYQKNKSVTSTN